MKVEVYIPDTLSEITLDKYQRYLKIQDKEKDENFLAIKMIEIFCGLRGDVIMKLKATSIKDITQILSEMFNDKPQLVRQFTMKGKTYGFIPKLEDMSFGEYVDLDTYIGDFDNIHRAMAVLYRPIKHKSGEQYTIEEYTGEYSDEMKDMPMDAVLSSILFFYHLGMDLSTVMMSSLEEDQETNLVQYLNSLNDGVGTNQFSNSLKEMLQDLKISLN
tara:strand:+ start:2026 stop:2676 length:651 start_codon:yes stop_codon:yes gene_type:complete